jgi:hypothetical protein
MLIIFLWVVPSVSYRYLIGFLHNKDVFESLCRILSKQAEFKSDLIARHPPQLFDTETRQSILRGLIGLAFRASLPPVLQPNEAHKFLNFLEKINPSEALTFAIQGTVVSSHRPCFVDRMRNSIKKFKFSDVGYIKHYDFYDSWDSIRKVDCYEGIVESRFKLVFESNQADILPAKVLQAIAQINELHLFKKSEKAIEKYLRHGIFLKARMVKLHSIGKSLLSTLEKIPLLVNRRLDGPKVTLNVKSFKCTDERVLELLASPVIHEIEEIQILKGFKCLSVKQCKKIIDSVLLKTKRLLLHERNRYFIVE